MEIGPKTKTIGAYTIIDPNPENHTINHEDLFIYASLKAKTKGRTFLTDDRTDNNDDEIRTIEINSVDLVISDSASRGEEKRTFLSTNWTEIGGSQFTDVNNRGDVEGFGITNVDIKIEGSYIPVVTIDFVDIRGATLFEQGSCSPYALFFHLPYPVFELTVKGYYGKPVTYYLNLVKFNTKFNSSTGNFEARGEFIGWSYAFLADVLMGYVRCANYMDDTWDAQKNLKRKYDEAIEYYYDNGLFDESDYYTSDNTNTAYLENADNEIIQPFCKKVSGDKYSCMTISDLMFKIEDLKTFLGRVKTDDQYVETSNLTKVRNLLIGMRNELQRFNRIMVSEYSTYLDGNSPKLSTATDVKEKTRYVFNQKPDEKLTNFLKEFLQRKIKDVDSSNGNIVYYIGDIKKEQVTKEGVTPREIGGQIVGVGSQTTKYGSGILPNADTDVTEGDLSFLMFDSFDDGSTPFQKGMLNNTIKDSDGKQIFNYKDANNNDNDDLYIDTGYITSIINNDLKIIDTRLEEKRNFIKEEIDAGVTKILGFRPTIRNVFTVLSCNVENFMQLLLNCSVKAEEYHRLKKEEYNQNFSNDKRRFSELRGVAGTENSENYKNVYPWPTYYETDYVNETSYSSGRPETKEIYPGEKTDFYDWWEVRFVEDFIKACEKVNKDDEALLEDKTGIPGFDDYTPINPLESKIFGDTQLKYREDVTAINDGDVSEKVLKTIGERMFITLDFSYYDPIRLNLLNFGLGHNIPKRFEADKNKAQSLKEFNKQRLWFHTLYGKNYKVVENLAKIDAHNLLSCIDDDSILRKLNQEIESGDLSQKIKKALNTTEVGYENIFDQYSEPSTNYKSYLKKVFKKNLNDIENYDLTKKYWKYSPEGGKIKLLGKASDNFLGNEDSGNDTLYIYSDIRKMKEDHLFKLLTEEEFNNVVTFQINYKGDEDTKKYREKLNNDLSESIEKRITGFDCSSTYISYGSDEKTKLVYYNGGDNDGKGLFTTLNIGVSGHDSNQSVINDDQYYIKYASLPVYVTNSNEETSGKYVSGYGDEPTATDGSLLFPFTQQTYQAFGMHTDTTYFEPHNQRLDGTNTKAPAKSTPIAFTLEIPGKGIFSNVELYQRDGDKLEKYKENTKDNTIQDRIDKSSFDSEQTGFSLVKAKGASNDTYLQWAQTFVMDTLVQLPIWLDNVNRFREATTIDNNSDLNRINNAQWGAKRPLDSNTYKLKSPQDSNITSEGIQNRNLAYLFLASCKPTPLITCGLAEPSPGSFGKASAVFSFVDEHYPKSIIPFLTSQGLVKIPKVWVYGIGSVLWRWKMYMGLNKDTNGNILWGHPIFGEKPTGLDPLAQPGHPSFTESDLSRKERSNSRANTPDNSYVNKLFKSEKQWISSNVSADNTLQTSCFAGPTIRNAGLNRSLTGGDKDSGAEYGKPGDYMIAHGCNFDYWGVYNADKKLRNRIPNTIKMVKKNSSFYGYSSQYSFSSWTTLYFQFVKPSNPSTIDSIFDDWGERYGEKYNPIDLSFRSAKEASVNTFWPLLWITPWQHFYTEPVNSNGSIGPKLDSQNKKNNTIVEKTLTFIPVDHKFREYVGNFGALGDKTLNYANRKLDASDPQNIDLSTSTKFMLPNIENNLFSNKTLKTSYITYENFGLNTWVHLEGGRYAELIALLPTFIKEKFVKEFENWVDGDWTNTYLKVVDPVNFDNDCETGCLGKSYRLNSFEHTKKPYALTKLLGLDSTDAYTDSWDTDKSAGFIYDREAQFGVISLDTTNSDNRDKISQLETELFNKYYYAMVSTPRVFGLDWHDYKDGSPFYANEVLVKKYLETFQKEWKEYQNKKTKNINEEKDAGGENDTLLDDQDIKLSLYRSFKSIVDKWISSTYKSKSPQPSFFFNIINNGLTEENTPLAGHFSYVNRVMGEIGNRAVLDVISLEKIKDNPKMSFYNLISDLLGENKFDFFPLPTFTNFATNRRDKGDINKTAKEMFSPYTNTIDAPSGPNFICMYVGGTSRILDLKPKANCPQDLRDMEYNNDSFSLSDETDMVDKPYEYQNPEEPLAYTSSFTGEELENGRFRRKNEQKRIEFGGITAFKVAYGIENQNMFKSVELDQTEFSETNESLMVIGRLADGGNPANRTEKGNNLHNVYLTRSYTCKVESLGNMMIQPLQYFDLTNIPMFYGTYLITKVEHNIKPHHITTNFTGVRQPIATVPVVEDVAVALNSSMKDIKPLEGGNVLGTGGSGGSGGSGSFTSGTFPPIVQTIIENGGTNGNIEAGTGNIKLKPVPEIDGIQVDVGNKERRQMLTEATDSLEKMLKDFVSFAKNKEYPKISGKYINITSLYRSQQYQQGLFDACEKNPKCVKGSVAKPGTSNHSWGIAVDFRFAPHKDGSKLKKGEWSPVLTSANDEGFDLTINKSLEWFLDNGYKYGFVIPYSLRDESGVDEYWHFEYHGKAAKCLVEKNPNVYGHQINVNGTVNTIVKNPKDKSGNEAIYNGCDYKYIEFNGDGSELTSEEKLEKGCEIAKKLKEDIGLTLEQATGVVGNLIAESGLVPNRIQGTGVKVGLITASGGWDGSKSKFVAGGNLGYGWAQWTTSSLKNKFIEFAKTKNVDLTKIQANDEISYGYLKEWITKVEGRLLEDLKKQNSVFDSAKYFAQKYERCANCNQDREWVKRASFAQQVYDFCTNAKPQITNTISSDKKYVVQSAEYKLPSNEYSQNSLKFFKGLSFTIQNGEAVSNKTKNLQIVSSTGVVLKQDPITDSNGNLKKKGTLHYNCDGEYFYVKLSDGTQMTRGNNVTTFKDNSGNLTKNLIKTLNLCKEEEKSKVLTPPSPNDCENSLKLGLDGSTDFSKAKNVIVGSSSVQVLGEINDVYTYYNCHGKNLEWLRGQIKKDSNKYPNVKTFFQVGIGTNDGFPTNGDQKSQIKQYTALVKEKFPNATLYVFPGTYGWGNVTNITEEQVLNYYKQYTDLGWTLLRPKYGNGKFISSKLPKDNHNPNNEWFKGIKSLIQTNTK
jgi:LAS superfamily LD-carboxypeptidase LdcB